MFILAPAGWNLRLCYPNRRCYVQLGLGALHDVLVATHFQELEAIDVVGNLLGLPPYCPATEDAFLIPDQVPGNWA